VLCQFLDDIDYTVAFKEFQEHSTQDAADAYYYCIWDTTMLEYLISIFLWHVAISSCLHFLIYAKNTFKSFAEMSY